MAQSVDKRRRKREEKKKKRAQNGKEAIVDEKLVDHKQGKTLLITFVMLMIIGSFLIIYLNS